MKTSPSQSEKRVSRLLSVIGIAWLLVTAVGLRVMLNYQTAAGQPGRPPAMWPAQSKVPRVAGLPTVVVMAHPHCPCTRASIGELALLMAQVHGRATATVVFVRPPGFPEKWEETDLWRSAQSIPGVSVLSDPDGKEVSYFQAEASGQTMLYGADGKLEFRGGITGSRGHAGDNAGRDAIVALLTTGNSEVRNTSVFGCSLHEIKTKSGIGD